MSRQTIINKQGKYYAGVMSGTSLDGVDLVIYDFDKNKLIASSFTPYSKQTKELIKQLATNTTLADITVIDIILSEIYSQAILDLLQQQNIAKELIIATGLHGQTIFHNPKKYSWQIGNGAYVAHKTQITTINNFRTNDILCGGEGAPLTPKYHQYLLPKNGVIVNLGGIANITNITNDYVIGYDSGPANTLIDNYMLQIKDVNFDKDGLFARSGFIITTLLEKMLADKYFTKQSPKSTGVEYFNLNWLNNFLSGDEKPVDIIRTLTELTAITVTKNIVADIVYFCGGGVFNNFLMERIQLLLPNTEVCTTYALGIHPNFVEATAFAYFAKLNIENKTGNIPSVTGALSKIVLGNKYDK